MMMTFLFLIPCEWKRIQDATLFTAPSFFSFHFAHALPLQKLKLPKGFIIEIMVSRITKLKLAIKSFQ